MRQLELLHAADGASLRVDAALRKLWRELLAVLRTSGGYASDEQRLHAVLARAPTAVGAALSAELGKLYRLGHRLAVKATLASVPQPWLEAAAARRFRNSGIPESRLREADEPAVGTVRLETTLFPAPPEAQVQQRLARFVRPADWAVLGDGEARKMPQDLARRLALGISQGETQQQIAKAALPYLDGSRVRARRAARTFGAHVAHDAQLDADLQMGDLLAGWQVHAVLDEHTRPEHASRSGTVYYRQPEAGQPGLDEMPRPPLEGDGRVAWNCRCWLSAVLRPAKEIEDDPARSAVFRNAAGQLVPDPAVYSEWFAAAPPQKRIKAVGAKRYNLVRGLVGTEPLSWGHFLDPETGGLLSTDRLERETPAARQERLAQVDGLMSRLGGAIRQVLTFGFLGE